MATRRDPAADPLDAILKAMWGRRFTQDTPVLPEVWLAYQTEPGEPQDLLLTPHSDARAGQVAQELRVAIDSYRAKGQGRRSREARVAHMPGIVAARLYFDELIRVVLPRTPWWRQRTATAREAFRRSGDKALLDSGKNAATDTQLFPLTPHAVASLAERIGKLAEASSTAGTITRHDDIPTDFLYAIAHSAKIMGSGDAKPGKKNGGGTQDVPRRIEAIAALFNDWPADDYEGKVGNIDQTSLDHVNPELHRQSFWRVSLNRTTEGSITKSTLAVKADAARRLFSVSCKNITWAVVDSGIDAAHPAFQDWDAPARADGTRPSRVTRTYDFTKVRDFLDPARIARLLDKPDPTEEEKKFTERLILGLKFLGVPDPEGEAPRQMKQLKERLEKGLEIDWALLEPFLLVVSPDTPVEGHGTHVAGILGANWQKQEGQDPNGVVTYKAHMQGVCPDIRLIDMRVLGAECRASEFEVIAALQFIRHLNSRADTRIVHGANLSLSTPHEVKSYACGSTPVCEECDRTWNSGVVLVAAAGNHGHQKYRLDDGTALGGYHSISITDPGNAEGVITVGATHRNLAHQYGVSFFSSRGPTGDGRRKPDLVAPGEKIDGPLPLNASGTGDGTSLAAPHVSGAAAMLMARYSELIGRPAKIKKILCDTATDLGREPYFQGAGMLDVLRAFQSI